MNEHSGQTAPAATLATALEIKAAEAVEHHNMLNTGGQERKNVLVGVSGGADSMALLNFLCARRSKYGITVYAAHINHGLRGAESERDEKYVREACKSLDAELFVLRTDAAAEAERAGETVEEAGRRLRYTFFEEHAARLCARIATAHTLSDNIETLIFNLTRGTGLHGLCGIPPVRVDGRGNVVIRPLIDCVRRDTEEYCQKYGVEYVNDSTNFIADCSRNKIRLEVIPKLYEINPAFDRAAWRLINALDADEKCLDALAKERLDAARLADGCYDAARLIDGAPEAVLSRCIADAARNFTGTNQEAAHIGGIAALLHAGGGKTQIKGGDYAEVRNGRLTFSHPAKAAAQQEINLPFAPGVYKYGNFIVSIKKISAGEIKNLKNIDKVYFKNTIDCDKIIGNAVVRAKIPGDTFSPVGRNASKTLKKLFNEAKIPLSERPCIPVAADNAGIVWVGGFGVCERCRVTESTENAVLLDFKKVEV